MVSIDTFFIVGNYRGFIKVNRNTYKFQKTFMKSNNYRVMKIGTESFELDGLGFIENSFMNSKSFLYQIEDIEEEDFNNFSLEDLEMFKGWCEDIKSTLDSFESKCSERIYELEDEEVSNSDY